MEIRENVRRRRRERIVQLLKQRPPAERIPDMPVPEEKPANLPAAASELRAAQEIQDRTETDPEVWWKEQQRRRRSASPVWPSTGPLASPSSAGKGPAYRTGRWAPFVRGFIVRAAISALLLGTAWGWFESGLPGSGQAKLWTIRAVTEDMDFQAAEAWYERTFGGSPAFLPIFRGTGKAQAVSGAWSRKDALQPADGRVVLPFDRDGGGVRIAAQGGSAIRAVYAGRVLQVAAEQDGIATVLIQHAGKIVTVYGNLGRPVVKPGDWVEAGQRIGSVPAPSDPGGESLLYFSVKRNGKTIDPAEVVPFD